MKDHEKKGMNQSSNNEYENIYILSDMPNFTKLWMDDFFQ